METLHASAISPVATSSWLKRSDKYRDRCFIGAKIREKKEKKNKKTEKSRICEQGVRIIDWGRAAVERFSAAI